MVEREWYFYTDMTHAPLTQSMEGTHYVDQGKVSLQNKLLFVACLSFDLNASFSLSFFVCLFGWLVLFFFSLLYFILLPVIFFYLGSYGEMGQGFDDRLP